MLRPPFSLLCPTPPIRKPIGPLRAGVTRFTAARHSICARGTTGENRRCSKATLQTLSPEARHLLAIASLLPAGQIPLSWLKAVGANQFPELNTAPPAPNSALGQTEQLLLGLRLFQSTGVVDDDGRLLVVRMRRTSCRAYGQNR